MGTRALRLGGGNCRILSESPSFAAAKVAPWSCSRLLAMFHTGRGGARRHLFPGWTVIEADEFTRLLDFQRSAHLIKIIPPLAWERPTIYMDLKLTVGYCYTFDGLMERLSRRRNISAWDLLVTANTHARKTLTEEFDGTRSHLRSRHSKPSVLTEIDEQEARITAAGHPMDRTGVVPDTYFVVWTMANASTANAFARVWFHEVFQFSMREQLSFDWSVARAGVKLKLLPFSLPHEVPHFCSSRQSATVSPVLVFAKIWELPQASDVGAWEMWS